MAVTSNAIFHSHSAHDEAVNGPTISFLCSMVLVLARRAAEGYVEVNRLLRPPFGAPTRVFNDDSEERLLQLEDDSHYATVINRPLRLRAPT